MPSSEIQDARETRGGVNGPAMPDQRGRARPLSIDRKREDYF